MCLVLMGKSASGKDTIRNILSKKYGFKSIITYTNRPMRTNEIPDITYHYITKEEFEKKINEGFFAEWQKYIVNGEIWYYGTAKEDLINSDNNTIVILTPDGIRDIRKNGINITVIYLYSNIDTIRKRLKLRNDKNDKVEDRILRDLKDFKYAENLADVIIYNNNGTDIKDTVNKILKFVKGV